MKLPSQFRLLVLSACSYFILTACSPEVGSEAWCKEMDETPKGDWSANMAADYAKFCVFKMENK